MPLADDIKANGQRYRIRKIESTGEIYDGRNRELGCRIAGVEPEYVTHDLTHEEVCDAVASLNLKGLRNLTASQRAMIASGLANLKRGRPEKPQSETNPPRGGLSQVSQSDAASKLGASTRSIQRANKVTEKSCRN